MLNRKRNVLLSFGLDPDEILMSDSEFIDTSSDSSDESEVSLESLASVSDSEAIISFEDDDEQSDNTKLDKSKECSLQLGNNEKEAGVSYMAWQTGQIDVMSTR